MKYQHVAREFYKRTFFKPFFSVNDLRLHQFHKLFKNPNDSGAFFRDLENEGLITSMGRIVAQHEGARGRKVNCWRWTERTHALWGDSI